MTLNTVKRRLAGWGRYRPVACDTLRPEHPAALACEIGERAHASYLMRGMGRSYGDSAIAAEGAVVLQDRLARVIDFRPDAGVLHCEAGMTLSDIIDTFLPRGFFLPVTPGTRFVTVGGAIAADVHGKNHHVDGAFSNFVDALELLTADGRTLRCSPTAEPDAYWATVGGMGLTGAILSATIRLRPVDSAYIDVTYRKARSLDQAIALLEESADGFQYSVAWIDCLARGDALGRSILIEGNHATRDQLAGRAKAAPLAPPARSRRTVPFDLPSFTLNKWTVKAFNALYYRRHKDRRSIQDYGSFFYPLDGIGNWNRIYGKRGFIQYQALFPPETSRRGVQQLLETVADTGLASFLSVLKKTGAATAGLLSFPKPGYTLAMDLPNKGKALLDLVARLDAITLEQGGRLYLAKDATMRADAFAAMYPRLDEFRRVKARLDPRGRFASDQARRLGLVSPTPLGEPDA